MKSGFWEYVAVEAITEINRIDVIAFEIAVHDGKEDLQKQIDCI